MANIKHLLDKIRTAIYGKEVRGSLADGLQAVNNESEDAKEISVNVEQRQDAVEEQFDDVLEELSDDREVDNAETIAARTNRVTGKNHKTLGNRLDDESKQVTQQLTDTNNFRGKESMINRKKRTPMITWIDDDGMLGVYTKLKPLAEKYNIPITSALITSSWGSDSGRVLTPEQVKELQNDYGFEFLSHTHLHDVNKKPNEMTDDELHEDFSKSQKIMRENDLNYRGVVFPFGAGGWSPRVSDIARQYFDYAIGTGASGPTEDNSGPAQVPPIDQYYIRRVTIERGFDIVKKQIDAAAENNGWVLLVGHVDDTGSHKNWFTQDYGEQIIEYALSKGLEFVTTEEGINAHGNIAQFGNTKISPDGEVFSDDIGKVKYAGLGISAHTPIYEFDKNKITLSVVPSADAEGFPDKSGGVLTTHRYSSSEHYSYQEYVSSRDKKVSMRYWLHNAGDKWGDWFYINNTRFIGLNGIKPNDPPFVGDLQRTITYTQINSLGNEGFPENKSGLLVNYAFLGEGFPFQEYYIYQESKVYKRYWYGNDWSSWKLVQDRLSAFMENQDTILTSKPGNEFRDGITITYISRGANDPGLPSDAGSGNLITYKQGSSVGRAFQEFREYNSFNKYMRYEKSDGDWSVWKKYMLE